MAILTVGVAGADRITIRMRCRGQARTHPLPDDIEPSRWAGSRLRRRKVTDLGVTCMSLQVFSPVWLR
jgi:hypothetical protein